MGIRDKPIAPGSLWVELPSLFGADDHLCCPVCTEN